MFSGNTKSKVFDMREWLSGGVSPCQGEGRGFESRLALFLFVPNIIFSADRFGFWQKPVCSPDLSIG